MKLGGDAPPAAPHYRSPAEELLDEIQEQYDDASLFDRAALLDVLERRLGYREAPESVRKMLDRIVHNMGIGDE